MNLPRTRELQTLLVELHNLGATPMIVGGAVRDYMLGIEPKDLDIEVFKLPPSKLEEILSRHGDVDLVGKSFGIYKLRLGGDTYDFSLPRRDSKVPDSKGHKSFEVVTDKSLTPLEASLRRDFTINSLFYDPISNKLEDPHGGIDDLKRGVLRHTSPAFVEDPLRSLRAVQFSARFGLSLSPSTAVLCQEMYKSGELHFLSQERIREEFNKFLLKGKYHTKSIDVLKQTMWLDMLPELKSIDGIAQDPQWHPEGDVITHTFHALEALHKLEGFKSLDTKEQMVYALGVLCHDLGKPETTYKEYRAELNREVITSPNHPRKGLKPTHNLLENLGYGEQIIRRTKLLTLYHMEHLWVQDAQAVRKLACKLSPANPHSEGPKIDETIQGLALVIEADHSGRPPLEKGLPIKMKKIMEIAQKEGCLTSPPKPKVRGADLIELGIPPGKPLGLCLRTIFKKQIESNSMTKKEIMNWTEKNLRKLIIQSGGPPPLITGETLKSEGLAPSKEFTEILKQCYKAQLSNKITNTKDAKIWLKEKAKALKNIGNSVDFT